MRIARSSWSRRRSAFTLIEMLVVIAIILILASLVIAAAFYWFGGQRRRNSEGTVRQVTKALQGQWSWVVDQSKKETPSPAIIAMAGNDPTGARAKVLWAKVRLMEAFPMNYSEVNGTGNPKSPDPVNTFLYFMQIPAGSGQVVIPSGQRKYLQSYQRTLNNGAAYQDNTGNSSTESAACLLMALAVSRGGMSLTADTLGTSVADTDNDGIKEVVDNFTQPLSFYRFAWGTAPLTFLDNSTLPYGIQGLNPAPGDPTNPSSWSKAFRLADPLDPDGLLVSWQPAGNGTYRGLYESIFHPITVTLTGQKAGAYVIPAVVSNGTDMRLGLPSPRTSPGLGIVQAPPTPPNANSDALDNVYSFKVTGN
jgi:prepilin-type N-terminal cleavage/methylation domain-containing protein